MYCETGPSSTKKTKVEHFNPSDILPELRLKSPLKSTDHHEIAPLKRSFTSFKHICLIFFVALFTESLDQSASSHDVKWS